MTADEFKQFHALLCAPDATGDPGYYPQMPFSDRMAGLWFRTLQRYDLARCLRALEIYAAAEPVRIPSLDAIVERVKALQPPPAHPWQQFPQAQTQAMRDAGYDGVLRSLLPASGGNAWARCWIWLFEQGFARPGREVALAAECRRFATEYPADAADWARQANRLETEAQAGADSLRTAPQEVPAQVGPLRQVSTPMGARPLAPAMWRGDDADEEGF